MKDEPLAWYGGPSPYDDAPPPPPPAPPDRAHVSGPHAGEASKDPADAKHIGVVIGRFSPPHFGHMHVVTEAFKRCGLLYVLSPKTGNTPQKNLHSSAVHAAFHEYASVVAFDAGAVPKDPREPSFASTWAALVRERAPNATRIFSSDAVGGPLLASALQIEHVLVDVDRTTFPISSTQVRDDVYGRFHWIAFGARPVFAFHVLLLGPECAGKTTLAREIAAALDAPLVDDQLRMDAARAEGIPSATAFGDVIKDAISLRSEAAKNAKRGVVVSDNSSRLARMWSKRLAVKLGGDVEYHERMVWERAHAVLLCHDDFGFVGPPERDEPVKRKQMLEDLRKMLKDTGEPFVEITGTDGAARVATALAFIEEKWAARKAALAALLD